MALSLDEAGNALFKYPDVFDLEAPNGYYQQACMPRQERALKRLIYGQLHRRPQDPRVGGDVAEETSPDTQAPPRAGEAAPRAYPAGKRLAPHEAKLSMEHAPRDSAGLHTYWDNSCFSGCARGRDKCPRTHDLLRGTSELHWTVPAQVIRRGGLRSGTCISPETVDGCIAQLRAEAKAEADSNVSPKKKASLSGTDGRAGLHVPDEHDHLHRTALQEDLRLAVLGADAEWLKDAPDRVATTALRPHPECRRVSRWPASLRPPACSPTLPTRQTICVPTSRVMPSCCSRLASTPHQRSSSRALKKHPAPEPAFYHGKRRRTCSGWILSANAERARATRPMSSLGSAVGMSRANAGAAPPRFWATHGRSSTIATSSHPSLTMEKRSGCSMAHRRRSSVSVFTWPLLHSAPAREERRHSLKSPHKRAS